MELLVIQNGRERRVTCRPLLGGADGNLQTLDVAARMVREDVIHDLELRRFTQELIAGCPEKSFECEVNAIFEFARSVRFVADPIGAERIADAWTTIQEGAGDCADLSILLSSMLGCVGHPTRWAMVNFYDDLEKHGFDHLYVECQKPNGEWLALDATPSWAIPGWKAEAPILYRFAIWPDTDLGNRVAAGVGGIFDELLQQGLSIGTQWAAGAVQSYRAGGEQETEIGRQWELLVKDVVAVFRAVQASPIITPEMAQQAAAGYAQLAQVAQQYSGIEYISDQWNSPAYKESFENQLRQIVERINSQQMIPSQNQSAASPIGALSSFEKYLPWVAIALAGVVVLRRS